MSATKATAKGLPAHFHELAKQVNNWGRWGPDDERGTLNLITPQLVRDAAHEVKEGIMVPLALPLDLSGPQTGAMPGRLNPLRTMVQVNEPLTGEPAGVCASDDSVVMGLQASTHWDALGHVSYDGRVYNGFGADVITYQGACRLGIDVVGPLVGPAVLLDVAHAQGVDHLAAGHVISPDDLDAAAEACDVDVRPGDVVLVRTGHMQRFHAGDRNGYMGAAPGLGMQAATWTRRRDVAAIATDTIALEVIPCEEPELFLPVHLLHLVEMGLTQGQNFDLESLAEACRERGRHRFLLTATPEPFVRATGAPVAPVAVL